MDIAGNVVVVTGGASALGAATVRRLAEAGARVVILNLKTTASTQDQTLSVLLFISRKRSDRR